MIKFNFNNGKGFVSMNDVMMNMLERRSIREYEETRVSKEDMAALKEEIPAGRLGTGEDVAKTVLFLEENDYVTGADIPVNGGFSVV